MQYAEVYDCIVNSVDKKDIKDFIQKLEASFYKNKELIKFHLVDNPSDDS